VYRDAMETKRFVAIVHLRRIRALKTHSQSGTAQRIVGAVVHDGRISPAKQTAVDRLYVHLWLYTPCDSP
jgi:hypothetical protein